VLSYAVFATMSDGGDVSAREDRAELGRLDVSMSRDDLTAHRIDEHRVVNHRAANVGAPRDTKIAIAVRDHVDEVGWSYRFDRASSACCHSNVPALTQVSSTQEARPATRDQPSPRPPSRNPA
jgi:hypothetical protein